MLTNPVNNPFDLDDDEAYRRWRAAKLARYPQRLDDLLVEIADPRHLSDLERSELLRRCRKTNFVLYASSSGRDPDKEAVHKLGLAFGLERLDPNRGADDDAITSLTVQADALHKGFIPYTDRPIAWHTDGYYNTPSHQIHAVILHCVTPADGGGENDLLDHEIAYIHLRDRSPDFIRALMHQEAMTIPPNRVGDEELRAEQSGPVFSVAGDGHLHMRYTDRSRSIRWRDDDLTASAVRALKDFLHRGSAWHFRGRLEAGWGLLCNNVLHTRTGFANRAHERLLYRARYYDRVAGT